MADDAVLSPWHSLMIDTNGASIAAQAVGGDGLPAVLLIGGATWSRDWWLDEFCERLAATGLRVIRYDARDTGESTAYPPGEPGYTGDDMLSDVIAVLDAFDVDSATIVGMSMGGGIAQEIAATHPTRVAGLVLLSSSPVGDVGQDLPAPTPEVAATFDDQRDDPDWSNRDAVIEWVVESERPYAGHDAFDEPALRELVGRIWDRTPSMAAAYTNHFMVAGAGAPVDLRALKDVPALVVHGSDDPLFPPAHGEALATAIGAPFLLLDGVGHQTPPPATWTVVVPAIARVAHEASGTT